MLMSVRQPGLAEVCGSVLGFEGDEFCTKHWKKLIGVKYKDVRRCSPTRSRGRQVESGAIELNPGTTTSWVPGRARGHRRG